MAVRSGNKKSVATKAGTVLPRNRALGPRSVGIVWDLLGPDVETRLVNIDVDASLRIAGVICLNTDSGALIFGAFERIGDSCISITRAIESEIDAMLCVSGQIMTERDILLQINKAIVVDYDSAIAVANAFHRFTDAGVAVSGSIQHETDALLTVRIVRNIEVDVLLEITDAGLASADIVITVVRPVQLLTDTGMVVLQRLAPDIDCIQIVYGLLICESHCIQL